MILKFVLIQKKKLKNKKSTIWKKKLKNLKKNTEQ